MITTFQIKRIHILKNQIGLDDDTYREMLHSFGVCSSKDLTYTEAEVLIDVLGNKAEIKMKKYAKKYDEFEGRADIMATPPQMRKIEAIWSEVCDYNDIETRKKTLRAFLKKRFHVFDIRFLTNKRARQIIPVLEKMKIKKFLKAI